MTASDFSNQHHAKRKPIHVLHCITSLDPDGAQHMLLKLCQNIPGDRVRHTVVNLRTPTPLAADFEKLGVEVIHLGLRRAIPTLKALRKIAGAIDAHRPDVIQGWMYHGNLAALAGKKLASHKPPILWNIRKAVEDLKEYRPLTRLILRLGARFSPKVTGVIYCGEYIAQQHLKLNYSRSNAIVIPNGFDTNRFQPSTGQSPALVQTVREQLGISSDALLVGMTARFHPHKDHPNFIRAASLVKKSLSASVNVHFILAGRGLTVENAQLTALISELGVQDSVHLIGERTHVEKLLAQFDVYCQSSSAEGFPNALGEAMSCGVPCISTNAGASAEAVGESGIIVPVGDSPALADGLSKLLNMDAHERKALGRRARERILENFSLPVVASKYESLYTRTSGMNGDAAALAGAASFAGGMGGEQLEDGRNAQA